MYTTLIGIKGYLSKPFAIHDLAMKIRELLDTSE
jgi:DNA-binding response OmpR family regulator